MKRAMTVVLVMLLVVAIAGCSGMSRSKKGAAIGAAAGAVVGAVVSDNSVVGAIVGAAVGGAAGAFIGRYMDKQAEEMEKELADAQVERVGEGIQITFESGILFDVDKAVLQPGAKTNLDKLAVILNKYDDTDVLIEGHTDATGSDEHNLDLSRQRAQAVANHLAYSEVSPKRFTIMGYGEDQPVATNDSAEGRQANRRVELAVMANEDLKETANQEAEK
jgi:outer membrane protein OmpA-like peptidoglycan-associated protein